MLESKSRKISVLMFLFAVFVVLVAFTAGWLYSTYKTQTAYSEAQTLSTLNCGKYYFSIDPDSVSYQNTTLYFEIENTFGSDIESIVVESNTGEKREVNVGGLTQGIAYPVSVDIEFVEWVLVYPSGCEGVNFKKLSFESEGSAES